MEMIKTLLVDDQVLFVESLKTVLETRSDDIEVVGIARDGKEALELTASLKPDVVLMDVRMPEMDGVEATRILHASYPNLHVMMLTTFSDDEYVTEALRHGAAGYVLKDIPPKELIASIRAIHEGSVLISPQVANKLVNSSSTEDATSARKAAGNNQSSLLRFLSNREVTVLRLIGKGYDNALIAKKLGIAEQTVKNHVSVIYSKLNIHNRVQVMQLASNLQEHLEGAE